MVDINTTMSVSILNVNGLNIPWKRLRLSVKVFKIQTFAAYKRQPLAIRTQEVWMWRDRKRYAGKTKCVC